MSQINRLKRQLESSLSDAATMQDPYPVYHYLRAEAPILHSVGGFSVVTRHSDVASLIKDHRLGVVEYAKWKEAFYGAEWRDIPVWRHLDHTMEFRNPPDHKRMRGPFTQGFAPKRIEIFRNSITNLAERQITRVREQREFDIIADLLRPIAVGSISEVIGIPDKYCKVVENATRNLSVMFDFRRLMPNELDLCNSAIELLYELVVDLLEQRKRRPADDLLTSLVKQDSSDGGDCSDNDLVANIVTVITASVDTIANAIANGLLALHRHPDELARVRHNPTFTLEMVDELLRYDGSVQAVARIGLEDFCIGDISIRKGECYLLSLGAANRDPAIYFDPDRLNLANAAKQPLTFGGGIHVCLGAQLARLEAQIVFETLFRVLPQHTIDQSNVIWRSTVIRGVEELPCSI